MVTGTLSLVSISSALNSLTFSRMSTTKTFSIKGILVRSPGPDCLLYLPNLSIVERSYCFITNKNDAIISIIPSTDKIIDPAKLPEEEPIPIPIMSIMIPSRKSPAEPRWLTILSKEINEDDVLDISSRLNLP